MKTRKHSDVSRRKFIKGLGLLGVAGATAPIWRPHVVRAQQPAPDGKPYFLITLTAYGGASIIDSLMAVRRSECANAATLNVFEDDDVRDVSGSPFRAVRQKGVVETFANAPYDVDQYNFVLRHYRDMLVIPQTVTSVNHETAQWRAMTGNGAFQGRTLQEAVAAAHGQEMPIPNVLLTTGSGFVRRGVDDRVATRYRGELVPDPSTWPLSLSSVAGIKGAPGAQMVERARQLRNARIDPQSLFSQVFANSPRLRQWMLLRGESQATVERANLGSKLMIRQNSADFPLDEYGLDNAAELELLRELFPDIDRDIVEAQAAMAFLLLKYRVSNAVTLGPNAASVFFQGADELDLKQTTIGFDYSHTAHRAGQAIMWNRVFTLADSLIGLLRDEPFDAQQSMWDRTLLYIATDFGRIRTRPPNQTEFSSGHDLNNGVILISPLLRGGQILGGIDPDTTMTHGADLSTGQPDASVQFDERHVYATILQALRADEGASGLPDMSRVLKG